ncbi:YihA family ribosome biogenesis GTP-binding protein [Lactobacillus rhamnosus]|uniref:Probable GTP-binding protein EngB n=1 Tax=Lacticaseibacillus rhamnosus TaxID=47715 RepID=A0A853J2S2_LACRH|nr:ribosome biogenesis GTP-binding protein YihA/YsxC [Lacticaseibacillus rhamnosus]NYZ82102.1 YihA family ribosome biogenesis GTP-binding protein [Lacticaseibacillus rhamnosus]NYZ84870.1 YihA family ribosome biogenesis GTP-binding protein [Lacticaseibacillus rhamnosus]NYZ99574.1 YihA family ribosome biogenesis GTP-binding protein [Lacticaseibacillus rhamnosus]NZA04492.1 YihA family ribosome biogenesis GTP-binding protein [Lacticaseibacillus rhamnosus]NZA16474.1 YihA family ribosome biogenesis 
MTISAVAAAQYPEDGRPEIAFLGRSNVGKSSLINKLIKRKAMARTSSVPGKTQTLNFYDLDSRLFFVDVPGYGYAKVSKSARAKFAAMIETYLTTRQPLRGVVLLVDSRHEPTADDISMYQYLKYYQLRTLVVATKIDKTPKSKRLHVVKQINQRLDLNQTDTVIPFSAVTGEGYDAIWSWLSQTSGVGENE